MKTRERLDNMNLSQRAMNVIADTEFHLVDDLFGDLETAEEVEQFIRENYFGGLAENELKAAEKLYAHIDYNAGSIQDDLQNDYLTINKGRDEKTYAYYVDDVKACAVELESLNVIDDSDKLDELFS